MMKFQEKRREIKRLYCEKNLRKADIVTLQITLEGVERVSPEVLKKLQAFLRAQGLKGEIVAGGE